MKEVKVYINGKRVTKEELSNYEITNENAKRIFAQALARINGDGEDGADHHGNNQQKEDKQ